MLINKTLQLIVLRNQIEKKVVKDLVLILSIYFIEPKMNQIKANEIRKLIQAYF